ncbi:MAG TPA: YicC/YloC family endoribonuclease, partial [Myxococcales bacterium]|nr:YicC/YloC family endoribonuclease [Myxococcales bacterium]
MIRSMTGFGAGRAQAGAETVAAELRSVNGKFCEVRSHLPRDLGGLEQVVSRIVKSRISRGVVDVTVRRENASAVRGTVPTVDLPLAAAYAKSLRELQAELGLEGVVTVHDLIGLEGVVTLTEHTHDVGPLADALERALAAALDALEEMRRREGEALARDIGSRLHAVEKGAAAIRAVAPESIEAYRDRLAARVAELSRGVPVDPSRLAQEVAFFAERVDVAEELTRLQSHLSQMRALLSSDAPAGRRLEFLVQEVNR